MALSGDIQGTLIRPSPGNNDCPSAAMLSRMALSTCAPHVHVWPCTRCVYMSAHAHTHAKEVNSEQCTACCVLAHTTDAWHVL
eukprot:14224662-Alexandrium_andersonii.AAC.1